MKQYIKDGKIYNLPIAIQQERIVKQKYVDDNGEEKIREVKRLFDFYTNDEKMILAAGYTEYRYIQPEKTLDELIEESNESINKITDERILNNFVWKEQEFYLTTENQTNFANMYIARDLLTYPQTIKTKTGYFELEDDVAVSGFYLAGINFVKQCLEDGWRQKAEAEAEIRKNYK